MMDPPRSRLSPAFANCQSTRPTRLTFLQPWDYPSRVVGTGWLVIVVILAIPAAAQELPPDIVSATGAQLPAVLGIPLREIAAFASHNGSLQAVHIQID